MSGSDSTTGTVAGAATAGAGVAAVNSNNDFLTFLGWAAIILGLLVLVSFVGTYLYKKTRKNGKK